MITAHGLTKWHLPYYKLKDSNDTHEELGKEDKFMSNLFRHLIFGF